MNKSDSKNKSNIESKQTTYKNSQCKEKVWNTGNKIKGKDPSKYRSDVYGNTMYYNSYGKNSKMGWQIDHIKPISRGGSDTLRNLQPLNSIINMSKSNKLVKKSRHNN